MGEVEWYGSVWFSSLRTEGGKGWGRCEWCAREWGAFVHNRFLQTSPRPPPPFIYALGCWEEEMERGLLQPLQAQPTPTLCPGAHCVMTELVLPLIFSWEAQCRQLGQHWIGRLVVQGVDSTRPGFRLPACATNMLNASAFLRTARSSERAHSKSPPQSTLPSKAKSRLTCGGSTTGQRIISPSPPTKSSRLLDLKQALKECNTRAHEAGKLAADREAALLREAEELKRGAADRESALLREGEEFKRGAASRESALLKEVEELKRGAADRESALLKEAEELKRGAASRESALLREVEELMRGAADRESALLKEAEEVKKGAADRESALLREAEGFKRIAADREAELLVDNTELRRRAEKAEALALELGRSLSRARQDAGLADVRSLAEVLSGETSTASYAELAVATGGFAASNILGRGGVGPVYRGEWGGKAVAIKRLNQVAPFHLLIVVWCNARYARYIKPCFVLLSGRHNT